MRRWIVFVVIAAGCTSTPIPATAPPLPSTTTTWTTTTVTTTTLPPSTTTTLDRVAEIESILLDLEHRRLQALYDDDQEALMGLFANDSYRAGYEDHWEEFRSYILHWPAELVLEVREILNETPDCVAVRIFQDYSAAIPDGNPREIEAVIERRPDGRWGLSWMGTGWRCDAPHPLGS
ncbi:MAG TPA: hypothetical protein ENK55_12455 [Actinobacteria bacterium]|nr:hypothetical protein [Actinomycetota bacterium]